MPGQVIHIDACEWDGSASSVAFADLQRALEEGKVLVFPNLAFTVSEAEAKLLDPAHAAPGHKNISLDVKHQHVAGLADAATHDVARELLTRYSISTHSLVTSLFPQYKEKLRPAPTSLRVHKVETRVSSWRKDDTRLHIDAFPSRPLQGVRILRVFNNIHPGSEPRVWRVGEPFPQVAQKYLPSIPDALPGSAAFLRLLRITKSYRTEYDHLMLQLHDSMKADMDYQKNCEQLTVNLMPGTTWICFSDQTPHAAMSGQHMLEQTYYLPVEAMAHPELAPLSVLEKMKGRELV